MYSSKQQLHLHTPAKFHSDPCSGIGGVGKINYDSTEGQKKVLTDKINTFWWEHNKSPKGH